jgi:hypothetical protein
MTNAATSQSLIENQDPGFVVGGSVGAPGSVGAGIVGGRGVSVTVAQARVRMNPGHRMILSALAMTSPTSSMSLP